MKPEPASTSTLSPSALAEGRRLMEAATDAPWNAYDNHVELDGRTVEFFSDNPMEGDSSNDTHLIAWMRNHLPALLSAAERLSRVEARIKALPTFDDPEQMGECISDIDQIVIRGWGSEMKGLGSAKL